VKSIVLLGIDWNFNDELAQRVAKIKNRMFLSIHELVIYEMQGMIGEIDNIDNEYVESKVGEAVKNSLEYEDSIISIDITALNNYGAKESAKTLSKIYVQHSHNDGIFEVVRKDRDEYLKEFADFVVEDKDIELQVDDVVKIINKIESEGNTNEGSN